MTECDHKMLFIQATTMLYGMESMQLLEWMCLFTIFHS